MKQILVLEHIINNIFSVFLKLSMQCLLLVFGKRLREISDFFTKPEILRFLNILWRINKICIKNLMDLVVLHICSFRFVRLFVCYIWALFSFQQKIYTVEFLSKYIYYCSFSPIIYLNKPFLTFSSHCLIDSAFSKF